MLHGIFLEKFRKMEAENHKKFLRLVLIFGKIGGIINK